MEQATGQSSTDWKDRLSVYNAVQDAAAVKAGLTRSACCRKQGSKARQTAAASHKQDLTLALTKDLPELIQKYQTDPLKV